MNEGLRLVFPIANNREKTGRKQGGASLASFVFRGFLEKQTSVAL
jgi:hypothetical protein